jgi:5-methylthioadenosine/S-adenosylhomocysteine deaminase
MKLDRLLTHCHLIDETGIVSYDQSLGIKNGKLIRIHGDASIEAQEKLDLQGAYVSPSFVNMHAHGAMNIFKGIAEDVSIQRWFDEILWPYESKMEAFDAKTGSLLAMAEMLDHGITCFAEHYFFESEILEAAEQTGIRIEMAPTLFGSDPNFDARLKATTQLAKERSTDRIHFAYGPHSPYTVSKEQLESVVEEAEKSGLPIHLHVSETKEQVEQSLGAHGCTPFAYLANIGLFSQRVLVGHGLWIEEGDVDVIGSKTYFAACPKTYGKLAMGTGGLWNLAERLNLSFGTDGAASSASLDVVEQARLFGLFGKQLKGDAEGFTLQWLWQHLMKGHEYFGFSTGSLADGYEADLIIWDLDRPHTLPVYDPLAAILYSSDARNIKYVMVHGEFVKEDGHLCTIPKDLNKSVRKSVEGILERGTGNAKVHFAK